MTFITGESKGSQIAPLRLLITLVRPLRSDPARPRLSPLNVVTGIALVAILVTSCVLLTRIYRNRVLQQFLASLPHVECTRQLVIGMTPQEMKKAMKTVREREIDLMDLYRRTPEYRTTLAWMLIERESIPYIEFVRQHPDAPDSCEARIWQARLPSRLVTGERDESTSDRYRGLLLELILSSPLATSRLASARWYQSQGKETAARSLYEDLLTERTSPEAGEAAVEMLALSPGHVAAEDVILSILTTQEPFFERGAKALVRRYETGVELLNGLERARRQSAGHPDRREFVEALRHRIELSRQ